MASARKIPYLFALGLCDKGCRVQSVIVPPVAFHVERKPGMTMRMKCRVCGGVCLYLGEFVIEMWTGSTAISSEVINEWHRMLATTGANDPANWSGVPHDNAG